MGGINFQTGLLVVSYFGYLLLGSVIFQALERNSEKELKASVYEMKAAFLENLASLTPQDVEEFVKNLTQAIQRGVYPLGNATDTDHSNWDFSNSFFFVGSIVSTIGGAKIASGGRRKVPDCRGPCDPVGPGAREAPDTELGIQKVTPGCGTLSPKTAGGQIFCVFFALFGIPLNIIVLHRVGKALSSLCERLGKCLYRKGMREKRIKFLTLQFFLVTGVLVFLGLPALVFHSVEGWTYNEGIYYAFITLSTIGFGDYVVGVQPGRTYRSYYRALVAIWILFGLAWIALLFNLLTTFLEDTERKIAEDLHKIASEREHGRSVIRCQLSKAGLKEEEEEELTLGP
ncbi:potassium channel subfamily K member 16-like isoform X1 [Ornithorhynchus anatinus]|uniref:Potassium channel domain-containing protein n=1 Tax=Ornithorhynchus anatinus TaxID=9258 RepID=A0A6I8NHP6_ORNAN|nr:potassium channel subfamily K member 16-like isoform X1 [Ornithorhynchus anatinus]